MHWEPVNDPQVREAHKQEGQPDPQLIAIELLAIVGTPADAAERERFLRDDGRPLILRALDLGESRALALQERGAALIEYDPERARALVCGSVVIRAYLSVLRDHFQAQLERDAAGALAGLEKWRRVT
jgi:hypothetical protein